MPSFETFERANELLTERDHLLAIGEAFQYLSDSPFDTPHFTVEGDGILYANSLALA